MNVTNPELRARLLAQIPGLNDVEPEEREYFLEMEEDMAEFRATGVVPERMGKRLAEARKDRAGFGESFGDMSEQDWESFEAELMAEDPAIRPSVKATGRR